MSWQSQLIRQFDFGFELRCTQSAQAFWVCIYLGEHDFSCLPQILPPERFTGDHDLHIAELAPHTPIVAELDSIIANMLPEDTLVLFCHEHAQIEQTLHYFNFPFDPEPA